MDTKTLELLDADRRGLLAAAARVREADRDRRPAADQWSVAQVLEHLASVERSVAALIAVRGREPVPPDQPEAVPDGAERMARLRVREKRIAVPDALRPAGA